MSAQGQSQTLTPERHPLISPARRRTGQWSLAPVGINTNGTSLEEFHFGPGHAVLAPAPSSFLGILAKAYDKASSLGLLEDQRAHGERQQRAGELTGDKAWRINRAHAREGVGHRTRDGYGRVRERG